MILLNKILFLHDCMEVPGQSVWHSIYWVTGDGAGLVGKREEQRRAKEEAWRTEERG